MHTISTEAIKAAIDDLILENNASHERINTNNRIIADLRGKCPHPEDKQVDAGRDSHYSYSRCSICQYEYKV